MSQDELTAIRLSCDNYYKIQDNCATINGLKRANDFRDTIKLLFDVDDKHTAYLTVNDSHIDGWDYPIPSCEAYSVQLLLSIPNSKLYNTIELLCVPTLSSTDCISILRNTKLNTKQVSKLLKFIDNWAKEIKVQLNVNEQPIDIIFDKLLDFLNK